jgi:two-component system, OmpR family, response regulator
VARLLVVDDDERLRRLACRALGEGGYEVAVACTGGQALDLTAGQHYDLVILDLRMPGLDGFAVLRELVIIAPDTPVLILSAVADVATRVSCLEAGAADFLLKPFAVKELVARVAVRLRVRAGRGEQQWLECGGLRLDLRRRAVDVDGTWVPLSQREFVLLSHLMRHPGAAFSREELLSDVWGWAADAGDASSNVVDACVRRLRAKLAPDTIETVRNVGYSFAG